MKEIIEWAIVYFLLIVASVSIMMCGVCGIQVYQFGIRHFVAIMCCLNGCVLLVFTVYDLVVRCINAWKGSRK